MYLTVCGWFLISFVFKFTALSTILPHWGLEGGLGMGPETSHVHKITYGPLIDTALYLCNVFDEGKSITRAIGRVGLWKSRLFWAHTALALLELFQGPKKFINTCELWCTTQKATDKEESAGKNRTWSSPTVSLRPSNIFSGSRLSSSAASVVSTAL